MTKKHFKALAEALKANRQLMSRLKNDNQANNASIDHIHETLIAQVASICAASNPNFDYRKFLSACK